MGRLLRLPILLSALWLAICFAATPASAATPEAHTRTELRGQIARVDALVQSCAGDAGNCKASAVPDDEVISAEGALPRFSLQWDWLRAALQSSRDATPDDRGKAMQASHSRLADLLQESGSPNTPVQAEFPRARQDADRILARVEFGKVAPPSWWDRLLARFSAMLERFFNGIGHLGEHAPWLGKVLEWLLFTAAAVGLLLFLRRNLQRQRLEASLRGEGAARSAWDREATDWAALAERSAESADWREAVHCLYWAAIVRLESRRAWRHNPARTPREYVRLLKPGSLPRESLQGLTGLLERVWYGLRPAGRDDYAKARAWFDRLDQPGPLDRLSEGGAAAPGLAMGLPGSSPAAGEQV